MGAVTLSVLVSVYKQIVTHHCNTPPTLCFIYKYR